MFMIKVYMLPGGNHVCEEEFETQDHRKKHDRSIVLRTCVYLITPKYLKVCKKECYHHKKTKETLKYAKAGIIVMGLNKLYLIQMQA